MSIRNPFTVPPPSISRSDNSSTLSGALEIPGREITDEVGQTKSALENPLQLERSVEKGFSVVFKKGVEF